MEKMNSDFALIDTPLTVSEINLLIKKTFEERFFNISITGEISSFRPSGNGHWYFTLKDEKSQISAVMFRSMHYNIDFNPSDGDLVTVVGNIDVYSPRGTYQIICQSMKKVGEGAILQEIEKRRSYYEGLGYFDQRKKKKLPPYPTTIGVVTASTGAAIQDILDTTKKRAPSVNIILYETLVQGSTAAKSIANAIDMANELMLCDLLIVGRGGGSIEDLLPFSEAEVIEAIHRSKIPIISAVGHEIDYAISDDVADAMAITPTAGAMLATEGIFERREKLKTLKDELKSEMKSRLISAESKLIDLSYLTLLIEKKASITIPLPDEIKRIVMHRRDSAELRVSYASDSISETIKSIFKDRKERTEKSLSDIKASLPIIYKSKKSSFITVTRELRQSRELVNQELSNKINLLNKELNSEIKIKLSTCEGIYLSLSKELEALNPKSILERGYAIVSKSDGSIIKDKKEIKKGDIINITLSKSEFKAIAKGEEL